MGRPTTPSNASAHTALTVGVALVLLLSAAPQSLAQPAASNAGRAAATDRVLESLGRRGDLTLRDASLESALFTISELWGVNIVAGKVEGSVNGVFKDAPLREILDSILLSNGYAYRPVGGSLVVSRLQDLGQINPFFVSETISVGASDVLEVVEAARLMSTPQGQVRALPSARAVLVVDFPDRVAMVRDLVRQLDMAARGLGTSGAGPRQLEVAYFRTHYVTAKQARDAIDVVLSSDGRVSTVEHEDRLLVADYAENIRVVEAVLARIDRPRPQVNIKALIYDISLTDLEQIGVNWNGITNGSVDADGLATAQNSGLRFLTRTATPITAGGTGTGGAFTFYSLEGDLNVGAIVAALQQAEDSRLLADPNVTVMDNEAASIESISEIPFQQLTQTTGGGNIGTTAFKEVGIKLDVTPKIARSGTIDMTVVPEFSRLSGYTPNDNQPIVETRRATTRVRIGNGQTIMIAGLRQRSDVGDFDGVPLLKDVRWVGHLLRSRSTEIVESELVVFITPEIVGYADPLGCRDGLTASTINCRLDQIPAAEGCPCDGAASCNTTGACDGSDLGEPLPSVRLAPPPVNETYETLIENGPSLAPRDATPPAPTAPAREQVEEIPPLSQATPHGAHEQPLRVNYDARFRATGGVYQGEQRVARQPAAPTTPPADDRKRRSTGDWLFWR